MWTPDSPDLNPRDFFLWGYSKENAYAANSRTPRDLKTAIARFIRETQRTCARELSETLQSG